MKFDALLFRYWLTGPSPGTLLREIANEIPSIAREPTLPQVPSGIRPSRVDTRSTYSARLRATELEMDDWIRTALRNRSCYAFEWFGNSMVVARSGEHDALLARLREMYASYLVTDYRNIAAPSTDFRGAVFQDYGAEAQVCWELAGKHDGAVLVLCVFGGYSGNWWRPATAKAEPLICRRDTENGGTPVVRAVYRVASAQALAALWSHASENDGIARVCAPVTMSPADLYDLPMLVHGCETKMLAAAEIYGWIYTQVYGGGADEHSALFAARDPALAERAYAYAAERAQSDEGWCLAGRF
ncbi:MAG TPA: hypothetical protein VJ724_00040 [Tahibacter sp.]|nr:hypothetical protein [Tahibacter sp.]